MKSIHKTFTSSFYHPLADQVK